MRGGGLFSYLPFAALTMRRAFGGSWLVLSTLTTGPFPQRKLGSMAAREVFVAIDPNFRWGDGPWLPVERLVVYGKTAMSPRSGVPVCASRKGNNHRALSPRSGVSSRLWRGRQNKKRLVAKPASSILYRTLLRSVFQVLCQIEPVQIHHLGPCGNEVRREALF